MAAIRALAGEDSGAVVGALVTFVRAARLIIADAPEVSVHATLRDLVTRLAHLRTRAARRRAA